MTWRRFLVLSVAVAATLSAASAFDTSLEASLDRFEAAQTQSLVEDVWAHQRRRVASRFAPEPSAARGPEDPAVRVEWYLRLGPARAPIGLEDLKGVRDAELLDDVLWSLVNEAVMGDIFAPGNDWTSIRSAVGAFLEEHPLNKNLLQTPHGAWWAWMQDQPSRGPTPWELGTLQKLLEARDLSEPLASLQGYCAAARELPEDQRSAGFALARETRAKFPTDIVKQRQLLREIYARKVPCRRLYSDLAEIYEERKNYDLASEQRSYALLQKLAERKALSGPELRDVARYSFEAGEWKNAYEFSGLALEYDVVGDVDTRVRRLLAGVRSNQAAYKDTDVASDAFESVLQEAFQSKYRDEILKSYAEFLEARGHTQAALEVWRWNFQYASRRPQRLEGLERAVMTEGRKLDGVEKSGVTKDDVLRWLDSLATLRRFEPGSGVLQRETAAAPARIASTGLERDAEVRASLEEIRKGGTR